jgi:hypothetical protein
MSRRSSWNSASALSSVIIGYGDYQNYRIEEIPEDLLRQLSGRYRLQLSAHLGSDSDDLRITIAIHEELERRRRGGKILAKPLSPRQLAMGIVNKGFQALSKQHHPDAGGEEAVQKELASVRNRLLTSCEEIPDREINEALIIPSPGILSAEITDEDIPF